MATATGSSLGKVTQVIGAVVDVAFEGDLPPIVPSIDAIFDDTIADIVVIATPLHTHAELASRALRAGADVLLEKPPVVDLASLSELTEVQEATGGLVQVGFQSLGSLALVELRNLISNGGLGRIQAIGAAGSWTRDLRYWKRARWAGLLGPQADWSFARRVHRLST